MATLNEHDLETLFSGAPQYFARSEGHFTGAPHPSVAFPWDETLQIRDLTDHVQIEDEAWSNVTAWPHITRRFRYGPGGDGAADEAGGHPVKKRSHYYPRCRERPSMLSMQGLEKGTVGYEAALELGVSDALEEGQYGFDEVGHRPAVVLAARKNLMDPAAASKAAPPPTAEGGDNAAADGAGGVKYVGETQILEELIRNGQRYAAGTFSDALQTDYFYNELFHKILRPTAKLRRRPRVLLGHGTSANLEELLLPQIEALLDVLAMPNVWIDFSHVEWRLRLGQILWASSAPDTVDPGGGAAAAADATRPSATTDECYTERYWLLLQLLLATELLLRLDAITDGDEYGPEFMRPSDVHRLEKTANASVRWSLILARAWLENIEVVRVDDADDKAATPTGATAQTPSTASSTTPLPVSAPDSATDQTPTNLSHASSAAAATAAATATPKRKHEHNLKHTIGWITTLTRKLTMLDGQAAHALSEKKQIYAMKAHNGQRQQRGLAHFAQQLRWPDDQVVAQLTQNAASASGELRELLNGKITAASAAAAGLKPKTTTAGTADDKAAGAAGANPKWKTTVPAAPTKELHQFNHRPARRRKVVADLHPSGWLSKTYQSGLVLPGDSLCNLLMATLLETDAAALHALGPIAHLGAGFVYRGKSFWSTACIVGRVLAAGAGAAECTGWISSEVVPQQVAAGDDDGGDGSRSIAVPDGWLDDITVADVPEERHQTGRRARLWAKTTIERESSVLGDGDFHGLVRAADFVLPHETVHAEPPPRHVGVALQRLAVGTTSAAELTFAVSSAGTSDDQPPPQNVVTCRLAFDVYFATAHPCVPSPRVKVLKSPSSPTIQHFDMARGPGADTTAGHALHKYYTYAPIHLTALLRQRDKSLDELVVAYAAAKTSAASASSVASSTASSADAPPAAPSGHGVLVIDCITGFAPQPSAHEIPLSPMLDRYLTGDASSPATASSFPPLTREISPIASLSAPLRPLAAAAADATAPSPANPPAAAASSSTPPAATKRMHHETRRRRFGSDMEILVRALCAEKGWNALISRRRRGCLACAIREAGALGWRVVIRVD